MLKILTKSLFRTWREHLAIQLSTLVVLTGTFTVVTLALLLQSNFAEMLTQWGEKVQFAVFISDSASETQIGEIKSALENSRQFSDIRFVTKKSAAETFRQQMGTSAPELLADPEFGNPLPASFEAQLIDSSNYQRLVKAAENMLTLPGVEDVSYGQGWIENYASLVRTFTSSGWILILIMISGSLLVVGNAVRNGIYQRRDEIEVLELIGATPAYIRLPFLFEGALLGFTAALIAIGICFALHSWQHSIATRFVGFWGFAANLNFLPAAQILGVLALGTMFGLLGSFLCVRHIATGWAAARRE